MDQEQVVEYPPDVPVLAVVVCPKHAARVLNASLLKAGHVPALSAVNMDVLEKTILPTNAQKALRQPLFVKKPESVAIRLVVAAVQFAGQMETQSTASQIVFLTGVAFLVDHLVVAVILFQVHLVRRLLEFRKFVHQNRFLLPHRPVCPVVLVPAQLIKGIRAQMVAVEHVRELFVGQTVIRAALLPTAVQCIVEMDRVRLEFSRINISEPFGYTAS